MKITINCWIEKRPCATTKRIFDTLGVSLLFYFECQVSYNSVLELKAHIELFIRCVLLGLKNK